MFTGLIEEIGTIKENTRSKLKVSAPKIAADSKLGDSISINGVCLTISENKNDILAFDVMEETFKLSNFKTLKPNSKVNLERAMRADSRFGGHMVQGHIDGTGKIKNIKKQPSSTLITIEADQKILENIIPKGSISIDGISLTVSEKGRSDFTLSLIPTTLNETTLGLKRISDLVNLETDVLGKYAKQGNKGTGVTADLLKKTGFLE